MKIKDKNIYLILISVYFLAIISTLILKKDLFMVVNISVLIIIISIFLLKDNYVLFIMGLITVMLSNGISKYITIFQYAPIYIYILMLIKVILNKSKKNYDIGLTIIILISITFSFIPLIIYKQYNLINILYSIFKRYGFLILIIFLMNMKELDIQSKIEKVLKLIILVNFPIFMIQFLMNIDRDFITGFLGDNFTGIIFQLMSIILCINLSNYYNKKTKIKNVVFWIILMIIYSAIAEVKFGFFVLAIILFSFFIFIKRGIKSLIILGISLILMLGGYNLYMDRYSHQDFLNVKFLQYYLIEQNYSGRSLNRLGFKDKIDFQVFQNNKYDSYFGKGIGTGNPSKFKFLQGDVNKNYDYLKYYWFTIPYVYIETGIIGTVLFILMYIYSMYKCIINIKKYYTSITIILINIVNMLFLIYNNSMLSYEITFIYWALYAEFLKKVKRESENA